MKKVYAMIGDSFQKVGGDKPAGFIEMNTVRPDVNYIAAKNGEWEKVEDEATINSHPADVDTSDSVSN